jgi:AGZA family xanthine/uracil permease-like MFS transporter
MLSDFFDTMGTVVGLAEEAGLLDEQGKLPGINRVLLVDSLAAAAGGAASASSNTTYIESAAGIGEGGRTGLVSVVVGALFLLAIFFSPIAGVIPPEATAPILLIVGYFMMQGVTEISWRDPAVGIPALLTIVMMPFTYSITNGVGAGFLSYVAIKVLQGKFRDVHPLLYVIAVVFAWYFFHGLLA